MTTSLEVVEEIGLEVSRSQPGADASALAPSTSAQVEGAPVGEAEPMAGSNGGFTMAVFMASDVPVGTKLYASPSPPTGGVETGEPVAWVKFGFIRDDEGRDIGKDEPDVRWGPEEPPEADDPWLALYASPPPAAGPTREEEHGLSQDPGHHPGGEQPGADASATAALAPEPPWPASGSNNSRRVGWFAYFDGREREDCPFPRDRADLQRGYREGWDAALISLLNHGEA